MDPTLVAILVRYVFIPEIKKVIAAHQGPDPITDEQILLKLPADIQALVVAPGQAFLDRTRPAT